MTSPPPDTLPPTRRPPRRWLRRAGVGLVVLVGSVAALVALLQLPPVATVVVRKLLTLAPLNPGNRLEVGGVSGNFLRGLTLEDVRLRQDGRELAYLHQLRVGYHLPRLRPPVSRLDELAIDGGRIAARRRGESWDLLDVLRKSADTTGGGGFSVARLSVRDVSVSAELAPDSVIPDHAPSAMPRFSEGNAADRIVSVSGMTMAAPIPWAARAEINTPIEGASAAAAFVRVFLSCVSARSRISGAASSGWWRPRR